MTSPTRSRPAESQPEMKQESTFDERIKKHASAIGAIHYFSKKLAPLKHSGTIDVPGLGPLSRTDLTLYIKEFDREFKATIKMPFTRSRRKLGLRRTVDPVRVADPLAALFKNVNMGPLDPAKQIISLEKLQACSKEERTEYFKQAISDSWKGKKGLASQLSIITEGKIAKRPMLVQLFWTFIRINLQGGGRWKADHPNMQKLLESNTTLTVDGKRYKSGDKELDRLRSMTAIERLNEKARPSKRGQELYLSSADAKELGTRSGYSNKVVTILVNYWTFSEKYLPDELIGPLESPEDLQSLEDLKAILARNAPWWKLATNQG